MKLLEMINLTNTNNMKDNKINILEENVCGLKCACGWNMTIGGTQKRYLKKIKQLIKELNKE